MGTPFLQPREFYAQPTPPQPPTYTDRSTGLMGFGIVQIVCGAVTGLIAPVTLLAVILAQRTGRGAPVRSIVPGVFSYVLIAVVLIVVGVGSTQRRRWGRALSLVCSWVWAATGVLSILLLLLLAPQMLNMKLGPEAAPNPLSKTVLAVIVAATVLFYAVFMVALPAVMIVFYRRQDVEETCKQRDPVQRWTDRIPLPVLAISLMFGTGALYFLVAGFSMPLVPFFGRYLVGVTGAAICVAMALLDGAVAFGTFRLKVLAWWTAVVMLAVRVVSAILTYRTGNLEEAYTRMGWTQKQLEIIVKNPALGRGPMLWNTLAFSLAFLGYLIWAKRYFDQPVAPSNPAPSLPSPAV